jgi:hypothetical protein
MLLRKNLNLTYFELIVLNSTLLEPGKHTINRPSDDEPTLKKKAVSAYEKFFFDFTSGEMNAERIFFDLSLVHCRHLKKQYF